ncbi:MAG: alpha/beta hydrolase-fold protein [Bacteroidia bacterium]|nr:alpha/beta hydrolase-fold protein [Bacteroidia bacterium]MCX7764827.1 alpha/beta hydrolase-fold protein [Bacteroidia bacterium]MDW8057524.1 alpha/beta hydrolase-fold protein [Bacteroidia bacterium]
MKITHHHWWVPSLAREMHINRYGESGAAFLAFPAQEGDHRNLESFGLIESIADYIDAGRIQVFTVDSYDAESWTSRSLPPWERGPRYEAYVHYILNEVLPFIRTLTAAPIWTTGVSMGAYHAANFLFRFPHSFAGTIALSGVYELTEFLGEYSDEIVYFNSPLWFLPNLTDPYYLDELRKKTIILCVGQGEWEEPMLTQTRQMAEILSQKGIPAWVDIWGPDVHHDWPWWRKQLPYFIERGLLATL